MIGEKMKHTSSFDKCKEQSTFFLSIEQLIGHVSSSSSFEFVVLMSLQENKGLMRAKSPQ
jgi:hypothetical protein